MTSVTPAIAQNHLKAEYIADILWHIYGDASETLLDGVQTTFSKSFEHSSAAIFKAARRSQTPRDGDGDGYVFDGTPQQRRATPEESGSHLFKRKNSDERIAEIHANVESALNGEKTSKSANELTDMLSELTVKELREIKIKYGMKASGRTKAEFVDKIAKRLDAGRRADQSALPGIKLSEDTKYWLKPILRVHQENRSKDDEQRKMVESVIGGKHLTPKQKTQAIDLFQRKYNELNSTLGIVGNRQGENQSKAVESVLSKLGVNAREEWKKSGGSVNQFPTVAPQPAPQQERMVEPVLPTRTEIRASQPPLRSASDRAARARAEVLAARASQSDKPVVAPMPVVAKPVSAPTVQYTEDQIMQGQVIGRAERALERQKAGTWNGPDISREDVDRLLARFPNASPRNAISKALFSRAMMTKADKPPKDADGDGLVNDGTPQEAPVSGTQPEQKPPERNVAPLPQRDDRLRTRDKVTDAIVGTIFGVKKDIESINGSVKPREGVTPEQEQAYRQVLNDALKQFPPGMIDNIGKNLKSVEMHKDMWSITKEVHERDGEEYNGKSITFGFFDPRSGSVHLDGNLPEGLALKSGGDFSQRGLYAHELAHAADKLEDGTYFSKSKGWSDAYAEEINTAATPLSKYATVSPSEGFAEFVRYATEQPQEARKNFPKSMKSVESRYGRM